MHGAAITATDARYFVNKIKTGSLGDKVPIAYGEVGRIHTGISGDGDVIPRAVAECPRVSVLHGIGVIAIEQRIEAGHRRRPIGLTEDTDERMLLAG
jgi:hypothetical protein